MINLLSCVQLKKIYPNRHQINFILEDLEPGKGDVHLGIQTTLSDKTTSTTIESCKLTFIAKIEIKNEDNNSTLLDLVFGADYIFDVVNSDLYESLSEDHQTALCSNLVYLDFRRRMLAALSCVGIVSLKLPLSLHELEVDV